MTRLSIASASYWMVAFCFLIIGSGLSTAALAVPIPTSTVHVNMDQRAAFDVSFVQSPRMSELVLTSLQKAQLGPLDVIWQQSALFNLDKPLLLKQTVLMRLANEEDFSDRELKPLWRRLRGQIRHLHFGFRVFSPLDPDLTRSDSSLDPKLNGHWNLILRTHSDQVLVIGGVYQPKKYQWQQRKSPLYYASQAQMFTADTELSVIQPDGTRQTHSTEYWHTHFQEVAPGAIIYVPIPGSHTWNNISSSIQSTNVLITELLRNIYPL